MNRGAYVYEEICINQDETHHRTRFWMHATFIHNGLPDLEILAGLSGDVIIQQDWVMMKNEDGYEVYDELEVHEGYENETVFVCEVWVLNNAVQVTCNYLDTLGFMSL